MPPEIAAELRSIGARIETQRTAELYAPLQPKEPYAWLTVTRDLKYGPHERNVLDVFTRAGHRQASGRQARYRVRARRRFRARRQAHAKARRSTTTSACGPSAHEFVGVTLNYRLAPQSMWPSGIEDLTAPSPGSKPTSRSFGGDPSKIVLWGHSAGAAHVADYVANAAKRNVDAGVAGAMLTSGFYDLGKEVSVWKVYYGEDVATYAERSSLPGSSRRTCRCSSTTPSSTPTCSKRRRPSSSPRARPPANPSSTCSSRATRTSPRPTRSAPAIDRSRAPCSVRAPRERPLGLCVWAGMARLSAHFGGESDDVSAAASGLSAHAHVKFCTRTF